MPDVTATSVFDQARSVYLNDTAAVKFTDAVLLPHLQTAYEMLRNRLQMNGISLGSLTVDSTVTAAVGPISLTLPADLLVPINIKERLSGSTSELDFLDMSQRTWKPTVDATDTLRFWTWQGQGIIFPGVTTNRQVRLYYYTDMGVSSVTAGSTDLRGNARTYLAAKVSALAKQFIDGVDIDSNASNTIAENQLSEITALAVKRNQAMPTRQRAYRGSGTGYGYGRY